MSTHDVYGKPWAKLSELKPGDRLQADSGFDCLKDGAICEVKSDERGLYVECADEDGKHHIDGQADDGEHIVGFYKVRTSHANP